MTDKHVEYDKLSFRAFESMLSAPVKMYPYQNIMVSVSGGSDSDVIIDLVLRCTKDEDKSKLHFVFFDTGIEYQATKDHLKYLEERYGIEIERMRPEKPIPLCCREYGQPFISKQVSEYMMRLQRHNFQWEDEPYDVLIERYPNCMASLKWWCNANTDKGTTRFCIANNQYLKEFIIENPPDFAISSKCCYYAKKKLASKYKKENDIDLSITGMRKSEGGIRATTFKSCFTKREDDVSDYRPIWWYLDEDKKSYEDQFEIVHSRCYTEYGFKRTGCAGCPMSRDIESDLAIIEEHEPKLYKAVNKVFGNSYEYTRRYREFVKQKKSEQ